MKVSSAPLSGVPVTSPRRRSIVVEVGESASATPAMSSEAKMNARSGSSSVTLHLDLDDLANPDVANHLHDDRDHQQLLADSRLEEELHMRRIDDLERHAERGGQRHQHPAGEPSVCRVHAHLTQNLEPLADDVCEVVENLG